MVSFGFALGHFLPFRQEAVIKGENTQTGDGKQTESDRE